MATIQNVWDRIFRASLNLFLVEHILNFFIVLRFYVMTHSWLSNDPSPLLMLRLLYAMQPKIFRWPIVHVTRRATLLVLRCYTTHYLFL